MGWWNHFFISFLIIPEQFPSHIAVTCWSCEMNNPLTMLNCVSLLASARLTITISRQSFLLWPAINVTLPHRITVIRRKQQQQNVMIRTRFNFLHLAGTHVLPSIIFQMFRFGTSQDLWWFLWKKYGKEEAAVRQSFQASPSARD